METKENRIIPAIEQLSWLNNFLHYTNKGTDVIKVKSENMRIEIYAGTLTQSAFDLLLDKVKIAIEESKKEINASMQSKYDEKLSEMRGLLSNK